MARVSADFNRISNFRIIMVWGIVLILLLFLVTRLLIIQVLSPEKLIREGNSRVLRAFSFEPPRGLITDRRGKILAISVPVKSVYADARVMAEAGFTDDDGKMKKVAAILEVEESRLRELLGDPARRSVRLKRYLSPERARRLEELRVPGLSIADNYQRSYPTGEVNAQLVGMLNADGNGVYGVEQSFNSYLAATSSKSMAKKDLHGHIIENMGVIQEGKAGGNLMLSVDDRLQVFAYNALTEAVTHHQADHGNAILMDVRTGEVLAMVGSPSFDPNERSRFRPELALNRALADSFEPGSTVKPLVALSALEAGVTSWNETFDTRPYTVDGKRISDSHPMASGSLRDILKYSSNTGMARIAQRMGPLKILRTLEQFGLGRHTSSGLVGEADGTLNAGRRFWAEIDKATLGFGYGIAVTAMQLTSAYATLANYGSRVRVSLLRSHQPEVGVQVASPREVRRLHEALETIVTEGTGTVASISRYRIAGKTGTARIAGAGGYAEKKYIATFAGFAPISSPRFALVVVIKNPRSGGIYGGQVSGPVFQKIMTRALQMYNIEPDAVAR